MKKIIAVGAAGLLASGLAWACTQKPMPPFVVNVSILNVAWMSFLGYDNPSRAAAMKNLDEQAVDRLGESEWRDNNYRGPVTYRVNGRGANIITEDKPCNKMALETVDEPDEAEETGESGGSGGSGGYYWMGGRFYASGGTCLYGCGGTVTVGEVDPQ